MNKRRNTGEQWIVIKYGIQYRHTKMGDGSIARLRISPYVNEISPKPKGTGRAARREPAKEVKRLPDRVVDLKGKKYVRINSRIVIQVDKSIPDAVAIANWNKKYHPAL